LFVARVALKVGALVGHFSSSSAILILLDSYFTACIYCYNWLACYIMAWALDFCLIAKATGWDSIYSLSMTFELCLPIFRTAKSCWEEAPIIYPLGSLFLMFRCLPLT
jgi:hypothetical protein